MYSQTKQGLLRAKIPIIWHIILQNYKIDTYVKTEFKIPALSRINECVSILLRYYRQTYIPDTLISTCPCICLPMESRLYTLKLSYPCVHCHHLFLVKRCNIYPCTKHVIHFLEEKNDVCSLKLKFVNISETSYHFVISLRDFKY